ncbi:hypothetical protein [Pseudonocardia sp. NPDC049154]|uniref:hypothetical protein n=1 Tax=Pseudonocardia sp. NPDC049154 TaxID=3155501 RepID=UPI00340A2DA6
MPMDAADVPVLLVVFNRPDMVRRLIDALREVKPRHIFVAADGPRLRVPDDVQRCADARAAIGDIDWHCEVELQFQEANLGCKKGPETAITWFLTQVPQGIVLEDDCIPAAEFFPFCAELLERYERDDQVMMIGGHNPIVDRLDPGPSYVFSRSSPTWGWATWRRAWRHYDPDLQAWTSPAVRRKLRAEMPAVEFRMARRRFDLVRAGRIDAWDFAWTFAMLSRNGVSVIPAGNMIDNVGFGPAATHTRNPRAPDAGVPLDPVRFPLDHPEARVPSVKFDSALLAHRFPLQRRILTLLPVGLAGRIRAIGYRFVRGSHRGHAGRPAPDPDDGHVAPCNRSVTRG